MNFFFELNWADYVLIGILTFSVLVGMMRGFIREVLTIAVWILAFVVAFTYAGPASAYLASVSDNATLRYIAAFVLLIVCLVALGAVINWLIGKLLKTTGLSGTDRLLGLFFGLARGILLIGVLVLFAMHSTLTDDKWWKQSQTIPQFVQVAEWIEGYLPNDWSKWLDDIKSDAEEVMKVKRDTDSDDESS